MKMAITNPKEAAAAIHVWLHRRGCRVTVRAVHHSHVIGSVDAARVRLVLDGLAAKGEVLRTTVKNKSNRPVIYYRSVRIPESLLDDSQKKWLLRSRWLAAYRRHL